MKPPTLFLAEMTDPEVGAVVRERPFVIVPVGSTEQHGPHAPLGSDVLIPVEVARRVAARAGAVVAPSINYGLSYPHTGFTGVVQVRIPTFMALIEDVCASLASIGFQRIVFLNGHYDNTYAIAYACANAAARMPDTVRAYPVNYWDGMTPAEAAEYFDPANGLHANRGETSAVLAINPALVDMERANDEMPAFPEVTNAAPVHTAFFFSTPGSVHRATQSGTWGHGSRASAEFGARYLDVVVESTIRLLDDIERTYEALPERPAEPRNEHPRP